MMLKMSSYSYPTKEEWGKFLDETPVVSSFGFPWVSELELLMNRKKTIAEVNQIQNLHEWDCLLNKKTWNLRQSFINAMVNFDRGVALTSCDYKSESKIINLLQYELYSEMTFYYLISTRDLILQIINLAWGLCLAENNDKSSRENPLVTMNNLKKRLKEYDYYNIYSIVIDMETEMKEAHMIRNSMVHSFSMLDSDRRSSVSDDGSTYSAGTGHTVSFEEQVRIMRKSLNAISNFMQSLRLELINKGFHLESMID